MLSLGASFVYTLFWFTFSSFELINHYNCAISSFGAESLANRLRLALRPIERIVLVSSGTKSNTAASPQDYG